MSEWREARASPSMRDVAIEESEFVVMLPDW